MTQPNAPGQAGPMRVHISRDEWWPVYDIEDEDIGREPNATVSPALVERWKAALAEFEAVQELLCNSIEKATDK